MKYKFWLVNLVSLCGMLMVTLAAILDYRDGLLAQAAVNRPGFRGGSNL